jgi:hypothetical protein
VPRVLKQALKRDKPIAEPESHAEAKAGLVGAAKHPSIGAGKCVRPQGALAEIKIGCQRIAQQNSGSIGIAALFTA